jgi:hypothetical protein
MIGPVKSEAEEKADNRDIQKILSKRGYQMRAECERWFEVRIILENVSEGWILIGFN